MCTFSNNQAIVYDKKGQALTEYILLVLFVVSFYLTVASGLARAGVAQLLMTPLTKEFAAAYQWGRVDASGWENGTSPKNHPRAETGTGNFRIFEGSAP